MNQPERRQSTRKVAEKILCIQLEPDNHAIVLNLSDGGLAFHAFQAVAETGEIQFSFSLPNHQRVQVSGELVWQDGTRKTVGLRFGPLSARTHEQIRSWALLGGLATPSETAATVTIPELHDPVAGVNRIGSEGAAAVWHQRLPEPAPRSQPEISGSPLLGDFRGQYRRDLVAADLMAESDLRAKFVRGFVTGAVVSALAMAIVFFAYGRQINDALAQFRGSSDSKPAPENTQVADTQPMIPSPAIPVAQAPIPPSTSTPDSGSVAVDEQETAGARASSRQSSDRSASTGNRPKANGDLSRTAEAGETISGDSATPGNGVPTRTAGDTGERELAIALEYLQKPGRSADGAAVAFLWSAVEKGNAAAEVTLGELYARGDGVTRSCDQARVLLDAAASKGSDDADRQLAQMARGRCD